MELGWWRSLDSKRKKPPKVIAFVDAGGFLLKPHVSFSWYLKRLKVFDLHFGRVKVSQEWEAHRTSADVSYDSRKRDATVTTAKYDPPLTNDEKSAFNSLAKTKTQSQDFGGNLRTPRLTIGEAFYLRILATFVYCIFSYAGQVAVLYLWNEKIAEKGANNCISVEHYQHQNYPSGAMHLVKWYDGTFSQCNNGTMLRYNLTITDPDTELFMYKRIDVKIPPTGHTYLVNDTWFGAIQRAAKSWSNVCDMADWITIATGCSRKSPPMTALYPPYVEGMHCKGDAVEAAEEVAVGALETNEIDVSADEDSSSDDGSTSAADSSSSDEEPLAARRMLAK
ncbi:hypothetical protein CYMTET_3640 [Cymbomonas tetramitiformis]|uniref:Uncharacterized protein n=1 Tax=Cymbomonas tetramitiformis TaxID=36881 RepID=A0AAE0H2T3_9CHLO|nr:hypothetical protein CYMTET_3640 [Cymbomonas tetramitiformis]